MSEAGFWEVQDYNSQERISVHSTRLEALCTAWDIVYDPDESLSLALHGSHEVITSSADSPNVIIRYCRGSGSP